MKLKFIDIVILSLLPVWGWAREDQGLESHKLTIKSFIDFGHLVSGTNAYYENRGAPDDEISMLPLNRANVLAIQNVSMGSMDVSVGLSGLIWWPYGGATTDFRERVMKVKPMIPMARARWSLGDPASTAFSLQAGTFPYKYNPDAKNLGEYLYRAGTYPGFLWSNEGWLLMNRAGNYSHGLLFTLSQMGGLLKHNLSLFMETNYFPVGDFSPGYDFAVKTRWLEFGGGIVLNHYLPLRPSKLTPQGDDNAYIETVVDTSSPFDPAIDSMFYRGIKQNMPGTSLDGGDTIVLHHWTFKGIKLMGRAALNLGHLLPEQIRGSQDLRLFAEAAVLGWKNQPYFYEKRSQRIPIMVGVNFPTFKLLDVISFQMEHYASPYNDIERFNYYALPIWETSLTDSVSSDDWKWSLYVKKNINKIMTAYLQVASDHFRLTDGSFKASSVPLTNSPKEWYYLLRAEFALR